MVSTGGIPQLFSYAKPEQQVELQEIAEGVYWLYLGESYSLGMGSSNLWLLEDIGGWLLVDTGLYTEKAVQMWEELLAREFGGRKITKILVTHFHPDHIGMAGWLAARTSAEVLMSREEYLLSSYLYSDAAGDYIRLTKAYYKNNGMDEEAISQFGSENAYRKLLFGLPEAFTDISEAAELNIGGRSWQIIIGRGHSYAHICLYNAKLKLLLAGDQVLRGRTPSLMLPVFDPGFNPLQRYLDSLQTLLQLAPDTAVLPAHGMPFMGLHEQLLLSEGYHKDRLSKIMAACEHPHHVWELYHLLEPKPYKGLKLKFAFEECLADVLFLERQGCLRQEENRYVRIS
ncbi:MBL fold metallo-hydrolase [Paenibacillus tarimensis]|uniref:MBL fold metallo-hydrolase n=1 Tax=Paenibacillus tarimensis TaxID=416012 RepID=UPI001F1F41FB|nr:MBL fold metallo-hydrolase [Paenibacillus tarimensis]MCF2943981.1 MBL fold metallo-hydrolase [Paenibacillus tarimensis]